MSAVGGDGRARGTGLEELRPGLWRWEEPHPEWRTRIEWGHRVACYAADAGDELLLVDPLIPDEAPARPALEALADGYRHVAVLITIPYHVRSAEAIWRRRPERTSVRGHAALARRLGPDVPLTAIAPGDPLPGRASAHAIGNPRRYEMPLLLASHEALAFGDAVVAVGDELRVWASPRDERARRWYRERFLPSMRPLLELPFRHALMTHGPAIMDRGKEALAAALERDPWTPRDESG